MPAKSIEVKPRPAFKDEFAVLIANGPSLQDVPNEWLDQFKTFGSNRVYLKYIPDQLAVVDMKMVHTPGLQQELLDVIPQTEVTYLSDDVAKYFHKDELGAARVFTWKNITDGEGKLVGAFSNDPTQLLVSGGTVTYGLLQIALWQGYNKIVCVGLDHDFLGPRGDHFSKEYNRPVGIPYRMDPPDRWGAGHGNWYFSQAEFCEKTREFYKIANEIYKEMGGWIVNATPDTKLDVFDVVHWEDYSA